MRDLLIDLNRYLSKYKYIIGLIVIAVILFLLVTRQYDKMGRKVGDSSANTTISESVSNDISVNQIPQNTNITKAEDVTKYVKNDKDLIEAFYLLCNSDKLDLAYDMLSDDCKKILYPTVEDFKNNYYNVIFKTNKDFEIISFKNNTYRVNFNEEAITMGNTNSKGLTDYVTVTDDKKINISGFIKKEQMNVSSTEQFFSVEITQKQVFVDYEVLTINVSNNIRADLYVNDASESGMYIMDTTGKAYYVDSGEYYDYDYYVPAGSKKMLTLRFKKQYGSSSKTTKFYLNNVKIVNKEYYEIINNQSTKKTTTYAEKTSAIIDFND